ncbi:TPA: glycosyltransferase family 2 protein, partial [Enterococcus faecium]|nr:glycosyltransferase family 2 protein [Enterococcus faecium]
MKPKVSIIIPAYNAEYTISRALESALKQTYSNKEIIVIDDGSKDRTLAICKEYQLNNHEIFIFSQKNSGVSVARNLGIRKADGEFIQFLDADDAMEPNMTEKLIEVQRNNDSDYVICGLTIIKDNNIVRTPHLKERNINFINFEDYKYIYPLLAAPCNKLFKKELIVLFEKNFSNGEDLLFNTEYLTKIKKISIIEDCLYKVYLDNENSLNKKMSISTVKSLLLINEYEKEIMN